MYSISYPLWNPQYQMQLMHWANLNMSPHYMSSPQQLPLRRYPVLKVNQSWDFTVDTGFCLSDLIENVLR